MPRTKSSAEDQEPITLSALNELLERHLKPLTTKIDGIAATVAQLGTKIAKFEEEQKDHAQTLTFLGDEISESKAEIAELKKEVSVITGSGCNSNSSSLRESLDKIEHEKRAKSIEISGLPFGDGEDLYSVYTVLCSKLNLQSYTLNDIDQVYRIKRSKRVVVRFVQAHKRDSLMAAFKGRKITTQDFGFKADDRVFVNEVLSEKQSRLLYKARIFRKENNYKYLWTKNQRIYLRKTSDSEAKEITSEGSLNAL